MYVELLGASYELLVNIIKYVYFLLILWFALCPNFWKAFSWDKHNSQILCMDAESSLCYVR